MTAAHLLDLALLQLFDELFADRDLASKALEATCSAQTLSQALVLHRFLLSVQTSLTCSNCGIAVLENGIQMLLIASDDTLKFLFDQAVLTELLLRLSHLTRSRIVASSEALPRMSLHDELRLDEFKNLLAVEAQTRQHWPTERPQFL